MADRSGPISARPHWAGLLAAALLLALGLGSLGAVLVWAGGIGALSNADFAALRFTLIQALLSALLSCVLAVPLARALARRHFVMRGLWVTLLGAPFILPVIVAVMGLLVIFGRAGVVNMLSGFWNGPQISIYGLSGVVLAHVFFNLPLVTRMLLHGWLAIPAEQFRLADSLAFTPRDRFRLIEWPMLRGLMPGAFALVFLICTTSFAVALILGGGPKATTVELAIYQAFRFEFDLGHAAILAVLQIALGLAAALWAYGARAPRDVAQGLDRTRILPAPAGLPARLLDGVILGAASLFIIGPMVAIVLNGVAGLGDLTSSLWPAILRSMAVAMAAMLITLALAVALSAAITARPKLAWLFEGIIYMMLAVSPLVIGTGLFLLIFPVIDPVSVALPITALINAALALPFVVQVILPAYRQSEARFGRLADQLGLSGVDRLRWVILPRLSRPLGFGAGLAAALSIGDLGVVALFADPSQPTLPLYTYQLMGAYRTDAAAGAALVLLGLTLATFWLFDKGGRTHADT